MEQQKIEVEHHFFQQTLSGFLITDLHGIILSINDRLAGWIGKEANLLTGKKLHELLSIGGRMYYETHLHPLLHMQGSFEEVMLELKTAQQQKIRVLVNAFTYTADKALPTIHYTFIKANDRLIFEQNLQLAKKSAEKELLSQTEAVALREQLIAVLGHDLRNPLNAINLAGQMLAESPLSEEDAYLVSTINKSSRRMKELIGYVMDLAKSRLGSVINIQFKEVMIEPMLLQVAEELRLSFPDKKLNCTIKVQEPVCCDSHRLAQLFSNLLGNAFLHGAADGIVEVSASIKDSVFELSVTNSGEPIPASLHPQLFSPFTRPAGSSKQQGLGLGLFIASEIAKAHHGSLRFTSAAGLTSFIFSMPVSQPDC